jgi:hypothetical protein
LENCRFGGEKTGQGGSWKEEHSVRDDKKRGGGGRQADKDWRGIERTGSGEGWRQTDNEWIPQEVETGRRLSDREERGQEEERDEGRQIRCEEDRKRGERKKIVR